MSLIWTAPRDSTHRWKRPKLGMEVLVTLTSEVPLDGVQMPKAGLVFGLPFSSLSLQQ